MTRIFDSKFKRAMKSAVLFSGFVLFAAGLGFGQATSVVNLTAAPTTTTLPDGTVVPMWGYFCGTAVTGATTTCAALNTHAMTPTTAYWSPVLITVPVAAAGTATTLTINLTNNLSFQPPTPAGGTAPAANAIPTSIMIVGQVGGGLGNVAQRTTTAAPDHSAAQSDTTWFIAHTGATGTPPQQGARVQSFGTEVAGVAVGSTTAATALTWSNLAPGTYLLESGTHPSIQVPMGLIGVLVVTSAPGSATGLTSGCAYGYAAATTVGTTTTPASCAVPYNAESTLEFSEIDPVQNSKVDKAVRTAGFSESATFGTYKSASGQLGTNEMGHCAEGSATPAAACYPPVVNYTPLYYLINGVAFNKNNPMWSLFSPTAGTATGTVTGDVLVRMVNAGLRMHIPSIVGAQTTGFSGVGASTTVNGFTLIAEDGNVLPGAAAVGTSTAPAAPRVQTDVFMAAGKTYDVMINAPAAGGTALPVFDRQLSLSGNSSERDAGMVAYLGVNTAALPVAATVAIARPDTYNSVVACAAGAQCTPVVVSDVSKGVIANDTNVYGVALLTAPTGGTLTCGAIPGTSVPGLCANGTFTYTPNAGTGSDTFTYCANGSVTTTGTTTTCSSGLTASVTLGAATKGGPPVANNITYTAKTATYLKISPPGVLSVDSDPTGFPLTVHLPISASGVTVNMDANGGFTATTSGAGGACPTGAPAGATCASFTYQAQNAQGTLSNTATATLIFPKPSNLQVKVVDAQAYSNCQGNTACINGLAAITDYRWIIEEDKTFYVDPNCTTNASVTAPGCPHVVGPAGQSTIPTYAVNFHSSHMEYVAQGCTGPLSCESGQTVLNPATGAHVPAACDIGNGRCDTTASQWTSVSPSSVVLDPSKRYYISVLPGDAANPFNTGNVGNGCTPTATTSCPSVGHTMGGASIAAVCTPPALGGPNVCTASSAYTAPVTVLSLPTPLPTGKLAVMVFEDDFPVNGEQDSGGGVGVISPNEPGLGGFELVLWDTYGTLGDVTGQDSYDAFNQPLSNALAGTIDPATGFDACPISAQATANPTQAGITGMILTCPKYESDNKTLSPLAGQAVIANLMPDKFSVQAYPSADRIGRGEEWIQTNTLDGQHPHDSFIRVGEPGYFQEYGPAGYHVAIGFANPKIINDRLPAVCAGAYGPVAACNNTITGQVVLQRQSRLPDERLYPSGSPDRRELAWTQCWVSLGDPDAEDFMFTKCDANGGFKFTGVPGGNWRLTIGDQWNDQIIDGLSYAANITGGKTLNMGQIGVQQWQSNLYTTTYIDDDKNGIKNGKEIGIPLLNVAVRYRDGHIANNLVSDFDGVANFNETFPLFNWYAVETDTTRYKTTGIHSVYDAGGPGDGSTNCGPANGARPCGTSTAYNFMANTFEAVPLPSDLSVPGAVYCLKADCVSESTSFAAGTPILSGSKGGAGSGSAAGLSTGRIDPPWVATEGWAGLTSQGSWLEFGKAPYAACDPSLPASATNFCATVPANLSPTGTATQVGENGGIHGHVTYASTRPFDDASLLVQEPWEPLVPHVTVNLYQEGFAADGVTPTLKLVDTTQTSSWDDWTQGFWPSTSVTGGGPKPYMSCPGQGTATGTNADLFFFTLYDQPQYLDYYNNVLHGTAASPTPLPYNSQFKCYDAMHIWTQLQPAPYDGMYSFPSVLGINPTTGRLNTALKGGVPGGANGALIAAPMGGTNCTICVANPDTTDKYRVGTPMLPPGKYVVEVIPPPGFEIEKEEDKNLLIGDNFIAPATQQFAGLGAYIFIMPDQASVASMYDPTGSGYNPNNAQNATTGTGMGQQSQIVPGFAEPVWPCVGEKRVVPDYLSLFPQAREVAPFAGATRPLCDRKEVTLANQMSSTAKFYIFTPTHVASLYTGVITDDFTAEFDPFAPTFGEKFSPPNMPVSTRDYLGNEISRVYSDHFGIYDGVTYSSWEVDPPNITGYSPTMMVQCMNDAGPVVDTRATLPSPTGTGTIPNPTFGKLITDPLYNSGYSNFCYEQPYMPGLTTYLDTPVVPTQAFVGAGYNNADCAYPDATPAIAEVDGDGVGPYVSAAGHILTITALGDQPVDNDAYSGPQASVAPFNLKKVNRHYGFGARCITPSATSATCNVASGVTIGGVPAIVGTWTDTTITVQVPGGLPGTPQLPLCTIQQQAQYGGSQAHCGQLVITAGNGRQSVDAVTVTVGGKAPTHVAASAKIQDAIDAALPGDLIIVDPTCSTAAALVACATVGATKAPALHMEMLIMWKPVRLQGVGAASTIINANAHPAGKLLDPWRRHVNCLFGLTLQGAPQDASHPYDSTGTYSCPEATWNSTTWSAGTNNPQIDRLPLEAVLGWDASLNGNLAELLQEPTLMGAYEGAGVTVLAKGMDFHGQVPWNDGTEQGAFPTVTTRLTGVVSNPGAAPGTAGGLLVGDANPNCHTLASTGNTTSTSNTITSQTNPFPSNFMCNPSSIDGLTITNSSQGGGGIFLHGWAHFVQIANNRIMNNVGTLTGGISVGQGEFALPYIKGGLITAPGTCSDGTAFVANQHMPMCLQLQPNVHNNMIVDNYSLGDELFSATLSGGGGATFCTGNDYYKFNFNWICGNASTGEGGGLVHLGEIFNGDIEHNSFLFNQSANPTIPTNGGAIMVQGTPDTDPVCPGVADADCPPGLSDGTGPNLIINANLIQGNSADSGAGGAIRLQQVNGTEVAGFATTPQNWNSVSITNNIINNNMAGWDGAGISLQDALNVSIVNNTIAHNDTLASSGVLTQSIGTPQASAPAGNCVQTGPAGTTQASCPQPAGISSNPNSSLLTATFAATATTPAITLTCPAGQNAGCQQFSNPLLANNIVWQNRAFFVGVGAMGTGNLNQQKIISLFNAFSGTAAATQASTGACTTGDSYWDLGVRGDRTVNGHESGFTLNPTYSIMTSTTGYGAGNSSHNSSTAPPVIAQYCNGSRVPPECTAADGCGGPHGFGVPPGIADSLTPNPVFSLTPSATVDEGNNWVNVSWGPLTLSNPSVLGPAATTGGTGNYGGGAPLANYALTAAIDNVPTSQPHPTTDFFGHPRPENASHGHFDSGAVEFGTAPNVITAAPVP